MVSSYGAGVFTKYYARISGLESVSLDKQWTNRGFNLAVVGFTKYSAFCGQHPINTRDAAVLALSDAQYVAPLVQTGDFLSVSKSSIGSGPNTFFYVFDYQTKDGDYPQVSL